MFRLDDLMNRNKLKLKIIVFYFPPNFLLNRPIVRRIVYSRMQAPVELLKNGAEDRKLKRTHTVQKTANSYAGS